MINVENEVYSRLTDALSDRFAGIDTASEYVRVPASFPHVSIVMTDSYTALDRADNSPIEKYTVCTFTIDVYSKKQTGRKTECTEILDVIDAILYSLNFRRESRVPVPNLEDSTIYRLTARYTVETDGQYFYRR